MKNTDLIILFGSRARGQAGKLSDTDIAVLSDHELNWSEKADIAEKVAPLAGGHEDKTDVVDLRTASPLLQYEAAKYGKLISGRPHDFFRFRILAWKRYQGTAKFRRKREKALKEYFHAQRN